MAKCLFGIATLAAFTIMCVAAQVRPGQIERGGEWLSWSLAERNRYTDGFISGYLAVRLKACNTADALFEVGQPHRLGDEQHPTDVPSGRCLAAVDTYSKFKYVNSAIDFGPYTNAITEFYTKHPEYQDIPFPHLMQALSDTKSSSADQLYQMVQKGELRPAH